MTTRKQKALRFYGAKNVKLEDIDSPQCQPDEVRLEIAYCGVCGTDLHEYLSGPILAPQPGTRHEHTGVGLPITLGHEMSGTVVQVGSKVRNLDIGQRVTVNPLWHDQHYGKDPCSICKAGRTNLCPCYAIYGLCASGGGFASEIVVKALNCIPLPENVSLKHAALAEPLAVAWHSIRISGFEKGQTALVLGAGPIGLAILILLRVWGARKCIVSEVTPFRAEQARKFGADAVVNPMDAVRQKGDADGTDSVLAAVRSQTANGVDVAFDATGLQTTLDTAIAAVRPVGTVYNVAIHEKRLLIDLNKILLQEKKLLGGNAYTQEDFDGVLDALSKGLIPADEMITSVIPLSKVVQDGFLELIHHKSKHVKVLVQPDRPQAKL